ncbi:YggT family protein [Jeotgalibaca caeni]|uniref:YggT family protein n=1 Tax=Jeotgalibaca caeni TaxID=3028623 RepID=UPI00237D84F3|nr:YggT family protein [Jeotgalibaca caeni]MDE1547928.1 YggT family protein [Jeotgalibaca caeni]
MVQILFWLLRIVPTIINAYSSLLVIYALMTWLPNAMTSPLGQFIARLVEPYLNVFRRLIPSFGMVSFSVLFAILFLRLVDYGAQVVLIFLIRLLV